VIAACDYAQLNQGAHRLLGIVVKGLLPMPLVSKGVWRHHDVQRGGINSRRGEQRKPEIGIRIA
jgi:hypothetical protein